MTAYRYIAVIQETQSNDCLEPRADSLSMSISRLRHLAVPPSEPLRGVRTGRSCSPQRKFQMLRLQRGQTRLILVWRNLPLRGGQITKPAAAVPYKFRNCPRFLSLIGGFASADVTCYAALTGVGQTMAVGGPRYNCQLRRHAP